MSFYGADVVKGVPTCFVDGKATDSLGGGKPRGKASHDTLRAAIADALEVVARAKLTLGVKRAGEKVSIKADVADVAKPGAHVKLRLLLVEEVARYLGRHGTKRAAKAVLIGAIPPLMLKTAANPGGLPMEVFDGIRAGVVADRSQFFKDLTTPFYGANRPGAKVSQGLRDSFWLQGMQAGFKGVLDCIKAFSETDFTEDLKRFDVPTLILHGDDDQIVPIGASAMLSSKLVKNAQRKVYPGAPHGMCSTRKDEVNADLLAFLEKGAV